MAGRDENEERTFGLDDADAAVLACALEAYAKGFADEAEEEDEDTRTTAARLLARVLREHPDALA